LGDGEGEVPAHFGKGRNYCTNCLKPGLWMMHSFFPETASYGSDDN